MRSRVFMGSVLVGLLVLAVGSVPGQAPAAHSPVEMSGVRPAMKLEAPVEGFLGPLNGKLKLRATEVEFEPGAKLGDHLHVGPGIRVVLAGELTVVDAESGAEQRVAAGGYFYEAGDKSFRVQNRAGEPAKLLVVEIMPASWQGSAMVPGARRAELEQQAAALQKLLCPAH